MAPVYLVWGDPRRPGEFVAYRCERPAALRFTADKAFAFLEVGPVPVAGPVISFDSQDTATVLADQVIPDWVEDTTLTMWGWERVAEIPKPTVYPFQVDVLLVAPNWTGSLDGWSSTQWFSHGLRPLQRLPLQIGDAGEHQIQVRILETGVDPHGVGYVVAYAPDRAELDAAEIHTQGWRREPWVRIRRQSWLDLAALSDNYESIVEQALRTPIVVDVKIHALNPVNAAALAYLPADVRDALEFTLGQLPD